MPISIYSFFVSRSLFLVSLLFVATSFLSALPTPPSLEELIRDSEYVAKVKLSKIREKKISGGDLSVTCVGEVLEAYKTPSPMPAKLDLAFMVLPNVYGKWLKATPREGEYILFFINKAVKDPKGNLINVVALYEPNPFAIHEYTKEYETKVRKALK
jgi:hypothetical protein